MINTKVSDLASPEFRLHADFTRRVVIRPDATVGWLRPCPVSTA